MTLIKTMALSVMTLVALANADIGVGYDGSLGGVSGLSAIYTVTPKVAVQVIGNYHATDSTSGWGGSTRAWYTFATNGTVNGNLGLGYTFGQEAHQWRQQNIELPFGADMFFNPKFSMSMQVGPQLTLGKHWNFDVGGPSSFSGSLSVHYWLN